MEQSDIQNLYQQSIEINRQAFEAGLFDAAYHTLMGALYFARQLDPDEPLMEVSQISLTELRWIDQNHPNYEHSTPSAKARAMSESIFARLSVQAKTLLEMRAHNRKKASSKPVM